MNVPATVYRTLSCHPTTTRVRTQVPAASTTPDALTPVSPRWDECFVSVLMASSSRTTGRLVKVIEFPPRGIENVCNMNRDIPLICVLIALFSFLLFIEHTVATVVKSVQGTNGSFLLIKNTLSKVLLAFPIIYSNERIINRPVYLVQFYNSTGCKNSNVKICKISIAF